jgi:hypothetical protein
MSCHGMRVTTDSPPPRLLFKEPIHNTSQNLDEHATKYMQDLIFASLITPRKQGVESRVITGAVMVAVLALAATSALLVRWMRHISHRRPPADSLAV